MKDNASYRLERTVGNSMHIAYLFYVTAKEPLGAGLDKVFSKKGGAREMPIDIYMVLCKHIPILTIKILLTPQSPFNIFVAVHKLDFLAYPL